MRPPRFATGKIARMEGGLTSGLTTLQILIFSETSKLLRREQDKKKSDTLSREIKHPLLKSPT